MFRRSLVILAGAALVAPFAQTSAWADEQWPRFHVVKQGESLWSISQHFLTTYYEHHQVGNRPPDNAAIQDEVKQIQHLNKDELGAGADQIHPGQRLELASTQWDIPDGDAGWFRGAYGCDNEAAPAGGRAPFPGLSLTAHLKNPPADRRTDAVVLTIRNTSNRTRKLTAIDPTAQLFSSAYSRTALLTAGVLYRADLELDPGEVAHLNTTVSPFVCGDVPALDKRLEPGDYRMVVSLEWQTASRHGSWLGSADSVRVVARQPV